ncbi:dTDP-4-dehydrorhamnose 3,5-epimerase [Dyadobacter sp. CY323]|uniref:dTDP-4-dehydrorhamnose 3,5-epimerase n=1 Tax=Dyadobacter sp. CY323 TaxID=2907302 RepID=UPI001F453BBA|nr:dTDP-4-dehydrorhamnose 3,5-epimerase [Dyadobacter sp. CY323]MCE6990952.1 dTDP-4-dehydrorhamnose 3,5-epimerase [Dyadobacter sp. CY323]
MINILPLEIEGVYLLKNFIAVDDRGCFVKTFNQSAFEKYNLQTDFKESYYSTSKKNVIRGMHFQLPPDEHEKLVYVTNGSILDVVLDIRKHSPTYGQHISVNLNGESDSLYIPKGCAHGFMALTDNATVVYNVSTIYKPESDSGILWDSFGFEWLGIEQPLISNRDKEFATFQAFITPF